jgi:protein-S-isoprenylcysteine O-methyltransferase Ste14
MPTGQPPYAFHGLAAAAFVVVIVAGEARPTVDLLALRIAGVVVLTASLGFWIPPMVLLTRHGAPAPGRGFPHTTRLVEAGPYAWVRHPQYLGYCLLTVGFMLTGFNTLSLAAGVAAILFFYLAARAEERYLQHQLGDAYRLYMSRVPRFDLLRGAVRRWRVRARGGNPAP